MILYPHDNNAHFRGLERGFHRILYPARFGRCRALSAGRIQVPPLTMELTAIAVITLAILSVWLIVMKARNKLS